MNLYVHAITHANNHTCFSAAAHAGRGRDTSKEEVVESIKEDIETK